MAHKLGHLCQGCGICVAMCPSHLISMEFVRRSGCYSPTHGMSSCQTACGICEKVCPFVPEQPPTAELTDQLFAGHAGLHHDPVLGHYVSCRVGYSNTHRGGSASGGLTTWMIERLLAAGEVDAVVCVGPDQRSPTLFSYRLCRTVAEVRACASSCYQPVEISRALEAIREQQGRYAVVALPCVARGLRLAMRHDARLRSRIRYILGLVCGQQKSRRFVEYICQRYAGGIQPSSIRFRSKRPPRPVSDYEFVFSSDGPGGSTTERRIGWSETVRPIWCNRWFTLECCDFCDDVFAECADAVFMDAWLPEYSSESQGRTIAVCRSSALDSYLQAAVDVGEVHADPIDASRVRSSQGGVVKQKRVLSAYNAAAHRDPGIRLPHSRARKGALGLRLQAWYKRRVRSVTSEAATVDQLERQIGPYRLVDTAYRWVAALRGRRAD